ncbi:hypothetical protein VDGL01_12086 [Verticillium dahliae]
MVDEPQHQESQRITIGVSSLSQRQRPQPRQLGFEKRWRNGFSDVRRHVVRHLPSRSAPMSGASCAFWRLLGVCSLWFRGHVAIDAKMASAEEKRARSPNPASERALISNDPCYRQGSSSPHQTFKSHGASGGATRRAAQNRDPPAALCLHASLPPCVPPDRLPRPPNLTAPFPPALAPMTAYTEALHVVRSSLSVFE